MAVCQNFWGVTAEPENAVGAISYLWSKQSGVSFIDFQAPVDFTQPTQTIIGASENAIGSATFKCVITDATTGQTAEDTITVTSEHIGTLDVTISLDNPIPQQCDSSAGSCTNLWEATANPIDNVGTVTYSWIKVSGDSGLNITTSTTAQTVTIRGFAENAILTATFAVTITDPATGQQASEQIVVTSEHIGALGVTITTSDALTQQCDN